MPVTWFTMGEDSVTVGARVLGTDGPILPTEKSMGPGTGTSKQRQDTEDAVWAKSLAIPPLVPPDQAYGLFHKSPALRPNIDAMRVNVELHGHRLDPVIDFDSESSDEEVHDAILQEKIIRGNGLTVPTVSDEEVAEFKARAVIGAKLEKFRLDRFFSNCSWPDSFTETRGRIRQDEEVTGMGYVEVIRTAAGDIVGLQHAPAVNTRLRPIDGKPTVVSVPHRISKIAYADVRRRHRFRTYVQLVMGQQVVYFKSFGDPRCISDRTGRAYASLEEMRANPSENGSEPATEIHCWKIYSGFSVYGQPRWVGLSPGLAGARRADELNVNYFEHNAIPPLAIAVSGGTLAKTAQASIEAWLRDNKGMISFDKVLVLEAVAGEHSSVVVAGQTPPQVKIEIIKLMDDQRDDALFQQYIENIDAQAGQVMRIPPIVRGRMKDFNRSTAEAALSFVEQQVFGPERARFDFWVNEHLFPQMGIRYWKFVSLGYRSSAPEEISRIMKEHGDNLLPSEVRELLSPILGRDLPAIDDEWASVPMKVYLAQQMGRTAPGAEEKTGALLELALTESQLGQTRKFLAHKRGEADRTTIKVPWDTMQSWLAPIPEEGGDVPLGTP